jgi:MSHA biogenesis protein MshG
MPRYAYKARGAHGPIEGVEDADSTGDLAALLTGRGLVPLVIKPERDMPPPPAVGGEPVRMPEWMQPKVTHTDVMLFCRQIHTLFKAGVPILRALAGLQETAGNPAVKAVLQDLRRSLDSGIEFSMAMAHHPKVFDTFFLSMVKVGEASGRMEEVFLRLFQHLEFEQFMRQQVKSALRYPSFVIMAMVAAVGIINVMVIPAFATVFKGFGAELPLPTKILLATSQFTLDHGWSMLVAILALVAAWRYWIGTVEGRLIWDRWLLKMPLVGPIVTKAALARFTRAFALALRSGVPIERALGGVAQTADNTYICQRIEGMRDHVMRGEGLAHAAAAAGVFTPVVLQMIAIGEETGMVDELLEEVGELYSNDVQYALKTLSQQIEPILIVFLGVLVLILALGVFLPMWNLGQVGLKK